MLIDERHQSINLTGIACINRDPEKSPFFLDVCEGRVWVLRFELLENLLGLFV
jgi:hypothetical protein